MGIGNSRVLLKDADDYEIVSGETIEYRRKMRRTRKFGAIFASIVLLILLYYIRRARHRLK